VELECPSIGLMLHGFHAAAGLFSGPAELGAVNPYAVHNHGQPTRQRHDRLLILRCLAIFIAHALSQDHFAARTSMLWAAS